MSLNIVFMGTPSFAVPTLEKLSQSNYLIKQVYSQPPKKSNRGMKLEKSPVHIFAETNHLPIRTPNKLQEDFDFFKSLEVDLVIVVAYGQIISKEFLSLSKHGFLNIHASILPKWRGAAPIQRSIMAQDAFTGISIMKIEEQLDAGPVLLTEKINLDLTSTAGEVENKLADIGANKIIEAINLIQNNKKLSTSGKYYERLNYAVGESHEPGSAFKVMAMVAALEAKVIDTGTTVDTGKGKYQLYGRFINDSKTGGYGEISAARALEVSSNIAFARLIEESFGKNPEKFIELLKKMHLNDQLGLPIKGEGKPEIPAPGERKWSKNALPSISYGYNLQMTPLQILTFYNAIANNGEMVKPIFVKEIRTWDKHVESFGKTVIDPAICSKETIDKMHTMMEKVVERGTGSRMYSKNFSMAGKTGTARTEYWKSDWAENRMYISSFTGYFPAKNPLYSCIVVIHKPNLQKGYCGGDVSGAVFKDIAQKIYTSNHIINSVKNKTPNFKGVQNNYENYYAKSNKEVNSIPNLKGMAAMDAISLLENLGLKVDLEGKGKVTEQSINEGEKIVKGSIIKIKLS